MQANKAAIALSKKFPALQALICVDHELRRDKARAMRRKSKKKMRQISQITPT